LLNQPGETVGDARRGAAVEAEDVLVEISRQALGADRAVVGPEQPAIEAGFARALALATAGTIFLIKSSDDGEGNDVGGTTTSASF
jgi:hypothetical protein